MNTLVICTNCFRLKGNNKICPYCGKTGAPPSSEAYHLLPGTLLQGRYLIGQTLGYGGFGVIYKAFDLTLGIVVAIKEFFPVHLICRLPGEKSVSVFSGSKETDFHRGIERFLEEARTMAAFGKDPNIVDILGFFTENGTAYIIMEFLDGISLNDYIKNNGGKIPVDEAVEIMQHVIKGVDVLHKGGIIHRDINPKNIMITVDNKIKIIDFGAAKFCDLKKSDDNFQDKVVTMGYAPPEQYRNNESQGTYTDIYAVGATLYRAITGVTPVNSLDRQRNDPLKYPSELIEKIPKNIDVAIMKAMAFKCDYRFQTAEELSEALKNESNENDYPEREEHRRFVKKIVAAVSFLTIAIVIVSIIIGVTQRDQLYSAMKRSIDDNESITVYIPCEDPVQLEEKYNTISENFSDYAKKYYNKSFIVNYKFVNKSQYTQKIDSSIGSDDEVTIFQSDFYNSDKVNKYNLKELYDDITQEYFFDDYYSMKFDRLPLGINVSVMYANQTDRKKKISDIETWEDYLLKTSPTELLCIMLENYSDMYISLKNSGVDSENATRLLMRTLENNKLQSDDAYKNYFLKKKSTLFIGSMAEEAEIKKSDIALSYSEKDFFGDDDFLYADFVESWSVADCKSESKRNVAILFLRYLVSDSCQSEIALPNDMISCNEKTLKSQSEAYGGVFELFLENPQKIKVIEKSSEPEKFEADFVAMAKKGNVTENDVKKVVGKYFDD